MCVPSVLELRWRLTSTGRWVDGSDDDAVVLPGLSTGVEVEYGNRLDLAPGPSVWAPEKREV